MTLPRFPNPFFLEAWPQGQPRAESSRRVKSNLPFRAHLSCSPASCTLPRDHSGSGPESQGKGPPALTDGAHLQNKGQRAAAGRPSCRRGVCGLADQSPGLVHASPSLSSTGGVSITELPPGPAPGLQVRV